MKKNIKHLLQYIHVGALVMQFLAITFVTTYTFRDTVSITVIWNIAIK